MKINIFYLLVFLVVTPNNFGAFSPNVLILVHGSYRNINHFRGGDIVRSYHEQLGVFTNKVVYVTPKQVSGAICMILDEEKIITSQEQLIFSVTYKCWRKACELVRGEQLLADSTTPVIIKDIYKLDQELTLYDLRIEGVGNYFFSRSRILACNS